MFKHILVPLDGSPLAEAAIPAALELASKFDSEITLLRVTYPPYIATSITWGSAYAELITEMRNQAFAEAEEYLRVHQGSLRQQGHKAHAHIVEGEPVADLILDMLDSLGIDAIVMSTHGRGGLGRWVFGSVADKVLRKAHVPILLIRAEEKAAD